MVEAAVAFKPLHFVALQASSLAGLGFVKATAALMRS